MALLRGNTLDGSAACAHLFVIIREDPVMKKTILCLALLALSTPTFAGGYLLLPESVSYRKTFPVADIVYHHVSAVIDGGSAVTSVEQEFFNGQYYSPAAVYLFPVPAGKIVSSYSAQVDGKDVPCELLDALSARALCESAARSAKDPSALAYCGREMLRFSIPSFSPRERKRVTLTYSESVTPEMKSIDYVYPLGSDGLSPRNPHDVKICVTVRSGIRARGVMSLTHPLTVSEKDGAVFAAYERTGIVPESDFVLIAGRSDSGAVFRAEKTDGDGHFMFDALPPAALAPMPKDVLFLVDVSGSMEGRNLDGCSNGIIRCLESLSDADRFQIVRFGSDASALSASLSRADRVHISAAGSFLHALHGSGGTNLDAALKLVSDQPKDPSRPMYVFLVTDGRANLGEAGEELLLEQTKKWLKPNVRFFIIGIGYECSSRFLERLAAASGGMYLPLAPKADAGESLVSLFSRVSSPVLTEVSVTIKGVKASFSPAAPADLSGGTSLTLFGSYEGEGAATLVVQGKSAGKSRSFVYPLEFSAPSAVRHPLTQLRLSRKESELLSRVRLRGENAETAAEIASAARISGVYPPAVRYYAADDELRREAKGEIAQADLTAGAPVKSSPQLLAEYKKELSILKSASGEESVRAADAVRLLSEAKTAADLRVFAEKGAHGAPDMKLVRGRAFYLTRKGWTDPLLQTAKGLPVRSVIFASDEYFDLLTQEPGIGEYLAAGKSVRFVLRGRVFDITAP